jgi:membrane protein YqaA with SNARE-associated domain
MTFIPIATFLSSKAVWGWLHRLGGPGLILLGIADASVVPLPGSMDAFTIVLAAHRPEFWWYYAIMATIGTVLGGWITYRIFEKGEEKTLEKKIGKKRADKAYKKFEKHGGALIVFGSLMPPPFPMVPILAAPGVLHYPLKRFIGFLTIGRSIRFFAVAFVAHVYGTQIIGFFSKYYQPMLYALISLAVAGGIGALVYFTWYRPRHRNKQKAEGQHPKEKVA